MTWGTWLLFVALIFLGALITALGMRWSDERFQAWRAIIFYMALSGDLGASWGSNHVDACASLLAMSGIPKDLASVRALVLDAWEVTR